MRRIFIIWLCLTLIGPLWVLVSGNIDLSANYRTANRESAQLAPSPKAVKDAVIQVYAARAFNWRGIFATHTWIAVKAKDAQEYTVYQVVGWRTYRGLPALSITQDIPDRNWYGQTPEVILDIRGSSAEELIPRIDSLASDYVHAGRYTVWPGPNSNTFPAHVARRLPELGLVMPANAIGKDFLVDSYFFASAPSGTGYQFSFFGLLGVMIAAKEGVEVNILGGVYGVRLEPLGILLPAFN